MSRDAAGSRTRNGDDFLDSTSFRNTASSFSLCPLSLFATCESSDLSFGATTATSSSHFVPPPTFLSSCEASTMGPASPSAARADPAADPATAAAAAALSRGFSGASGASVAPRHVPVQDTAARHRRQHESFITLLFIGGDKHNSSFRLLLCVFSLSASLSELASRTTSEPRLPRAGAPPLSPHV